MKTKSVDDNAKDRKKKDGKRLVFAKALY